MQQQKLDSKGRSRRPTPFKFTASILSCACRSLVLATLFCHERKREMRFRCFIERDRLSASISLTQKSCSSSPNRGWLQMTEEMGSFRVVRYPGLDGEWTKGEEGNQAGFTSKRTANPDFVPGNESIRRTVPIAFMMSSGSFPSGGHWSNSFTRSPMAGQVSEMK